MISGTTSEGVTADGTTRRAVLAGLGTLALGAVGPVSGRARKPNTLRGDQSAPVDDPLPDPAALETFVDDVMTDRIGNHIPGATVAIVAGETPVLTKGYGYADAEAETPVRADETTFRAGSVGKLVTWTAVMQGVEQGVLDLDEDINTYLRDSEVEVPDTYDKPVTLRHLGTHTAGFESALDPEVVPDPEDLAPLETLLAEQQPDRVRPPDTAVGYSNYGAALAGHIVAEVHDTTFEKYVQSAIFEPLGMTHSTFAQPVPKEHPGDLAVGHTQSGETFSAADDVYINMRPAGSLSTTATDMATFMNAHLGGGSVGDTRVLDVDTTRTMHSQHYERHPAVNNWRYGFHGYGAPDANLLSHSGGTIHFRSRLVLAPEHNVGIFVNYNLKSETEPPAAVADEIIEEYRLQPSPSPPDPTGKPGGRERAEAVTGEYSVTFLPQSGPLQFVGLMAHVTVNSTDERRLVTTTLDGDKREWVETEPYVFQEVRGHDVLAFEMSDGDVEAMNMSSTLEGVYTPVPPRKRQLVAGGVVGASLSGVTPSLLGWGAHSTWRRLNGKRSDDAADEEGSG